MFCPVYHVNHVQINGSIVELHTEAQMLHVQSGKHIYVAYWDNEKVGEIIAQHAVGDIISFSAVVVQEENNDFLLLSQVTSEPTVVIAGNVCKGYTRKVITIANEEKPVMEFTLVQSSFNESNSNFVRCECWNEKLFRHITEGNYITVAGAIKQRFYADKEGANRSQIVVSAYRVSGGKQGSTVIPTVKSIPRPSFVKTGTTSNEAAAEIAGEPIDF